MKGKKDKKKGDKVGAPVAGFGRRDLMKIGLGAGVATMSQMVAAPRASAQMDQMAPQLGEGATSRVKGLVYETKMGWKNTANRRGGNGPMDETTRQIVEYVHSYSESNFTATGKEEINWLMMDSIAALIAGFECEAARISARLAQQCPPGDKKCTVLGYGISTTPEMAAFANSCMIRAYDYNDIGGGGHTSDIIPGILAVGEALHSSGSDVLTAIAVAYEIAAANAYGRGGGWDGPFEVVATAMGAGKLMGLNQDLLANAVSLAIVPHMPMLVSHVGALSMWKGVHSPEAVKCGVWSALLAREGMTAPSRPFEARDAMWDHMGAPPIPLRLPVRSDGKMNAESMLYKRFPSEISTQAFLELTPLIRKEVKAEDIASILIEMAFGGWQEIGDPPKFDPQNRETADHSIAYVVARYLIDGDIYMDSFTREKYMDPAAKALLAVTTIRPNPEKTGGHPRLTVTTKSGKVVTKEFTGVPGTPPGDMRGRANTPMTHDETIKKYNRACAYHKMTDDQRDKTRELWANLRAVKDIAEPMQALAKFGQSRPLSDRTPPQIY